MKLRVIEFTAVITLKEFDIFGEVCFDISGKLGVFGENISFGSERIHPQKIRILIQKQNIIFVTADALNRRSP